VIEPRYVLDWAGKLSPGPEVSVPEVSVLPGAGHYFHGRLHDLKQVVQGFMGPAV